MRVSLSCESSHVHVVRVRRREHVRGGHGHGCRAKVFTSIGCPCATLERLVDVVCACVSVLLLFFVPVAWVHKEVLT